MAKVLTPELAAQYFQRQGVKLGVWNGLEALQPRANFVASTFCTGKSVYELINFSKHVAGWLAKGSWKILQIDNSSFFYPEQSAVLCALLIGPTQQVDLVKQRTFLFEFDADLRAVFQTEVVLAHLINLMLIYEAHCYLISAGGGPGEMLAVQDGFVYFYGDDGRVAQAQKLLNDFEANPNGVAPWIAVASKEE